MKPAIKKVKKYKSKNKDLVKYFLLFGGTAVLVLLAVFVTTGQTFELRSRAAAEAPQITSVSPSSTYPNQQITITGKKFGTQKKCLCFTSGGNTNCTSTMFSKIDSWTDTKIKAIVAEDPQLIGSGLVTVKTGTNCDNSSNQTILSIRPYVESVSLNLAYPSTKINIKGRGFGKTPHRLCFTVAGLRGCTPAQFIIDSWSNKEVKLTVTGNPPVRGKGSVVLERVEGGNTVLSNTISLSIIPSLSSLSTSSASPGTDVVLIGVGFGSQKNRLCFTVGTKTDCSFTINSWTDTQIKAKVPTNPSYRGKGLIKVMRKTSSTTEVATNQLEFTIPK